MGVRRYLDKQTTKSSELGLPPLRKRLIYRLLIVTLKMRHGIYIFFNVRLWKAFMFQKGRWDVKFAVLLLGKELISWIKDTFSLHARHWLSCVSGTSLRLMGRDCFSSVVHYFFLRY